MYVHPTSIRTYRAAKHTARIRTSTAPTRAASSRRGAQKGGTGQAKHPKGGTYQAACHNFQSYNPLNQVMTPAASEDRAHNLRIMRPTRYQLHYSRMLIEIPGNTPNHRITKCKLKTHTSLLSCSYIANLFDNLCHSVADSIRHHSSEHKRCL